jgi:hypothetical protein
MSEEEVITQTRRWLEKAVIGLNLCPFAKAVYVKNQVRLVVSRARHADDLLEELDRELDLLVATPAEEIDTTLLIHAKLFEDFLDFNDFLTDCDDVLQDFAPDVLQTDIDDFAALHLPAQLQRLPGKSTYCKTQQFHYVMR